MYIYVSMCVYMFVSNGESIEGCECSRADLRRYVCVRYMCVLCMYMYVCMGVLSF